MLIVLNLLVKPLAIFGIDAGVQNEVGTENYGLYFSLLNLSYLFNIFLDLGVNNYTTKNIAKYPAIVPRYMGKLLALKIILFVVYACVTLVLAKLIGINIFGFSILWILILNQFFVVFIAYLRSHFTGLLLFKSEALLSVLDKILLIFIAGYCLYFSDIKMTISLFVYIQLLCYLITFIIAFAILMKQIGAPRIKWNPIFTLAILKNSLPYALLILLMMFYSRTDSIMIERMLPDGDLQSGYYAQGFRLLDAVFVFSMLFSSLLFPIFSRMLKNKLNIESLLRSSLGILLSGALVLALVCLLYGKQILSWIYTDIDSLAINSFAFLMLSFIGLCVILIYGTLLTANGNLKFLNTISAIGIVVNIVLNLLLIPKYGAPGAAFTTFVTQSIIAITQFIYAKRIFNLKLSFEFSGRFILFMLLLASGSYLFYKIDLNYNLKILLTLILGLILALVCKIIDIKGIKNQMLTEAVNEQ